MTTNYERIKNISIEELQKITVSALNRLDKIAEYSKPTPFNFLGLKIGKAEFWNMEQELTHLLATAKFEQQEAQDE